MGKAEFKSHRPRRPRKTGFWYRTVTDLNYMNYIKKKSLFEQSQDTNVHENPQTKEVLILCEVTCEHNEVHLSMSDKITETF